MKLSIKKGDFVKVIAGADKGKTAQIVAVNADNGRVIIEGKEIGQLKKAKKARKSTDVSGLVNINKSVDASNVMPICGECGKATRVKHALVDGKKVRVCGKCGAVLETKKKEDKKAKATVRKRTKKAAAPVEAPVEAVAEAPVSGDATVSE